MKLPANLKVIVDKRRKMGIADLDGRVIIPCRYRDTQELEAMLCCITPDGRFILPDRCRVIEAFEQVIHIYGMDEFRHNLMTYQGDLTSRSGYRSVFRLRTFENYVVELETDPAQGNFRWGWVLLNGLGQEVSGLYWHMDFLTYFPLLRVMAFIEGRKPAAAGFIDMNGKLVIPLMYDEASPFNEAGLATVRLGAAWGVINAQNEIVVDLVHATAQVAAARSGSSWSHMHVCDIH